MDIISVIGNFFMEGGFFMYPVLFVAALGTAIVIERMLYISLASADAEGLWKQIRPALSDHRIDDAIKACQPGKRPIQHVLLAGLRAAKPAGAREPVQRSMEEAMLEVLPPLERRTPYLPILANVATLRRYRPRIRRRRRSSWPTGSRWR
jgi:hypothetical protein